MKKQANKHLRWYAVRALWCIAVAVSIVFVYAKTNIPAQAGEHVSRFLGYAFNDMATNNSEGLLNPLIGIGIIVGSTFAVWRLRTMNRQASAAEGGHRDGRFEKGAEMMSAEVLTARIGGIAALERLAKEHPSEYHVQCNKMLCAFVRYRFADEESGINLADEIRKCRPDIEIAAQIIASRKIGREKIIEKIEKRNGYTVNLSGSNLYEAYLSYSDYSNANLVSVQFGAADLSFSYLYGAWLSNSTLTAAILLYADLSYARLLGADLVKANLEGAKLNYANLNGADLKDVKMVDANLSNASFLRSDLTSANLEGANLSDTKFAYADLTGASLSQARFKDTVLSENNLSGAKLRNVRNLDQAELDKCFIKKGMNEPDLEGSKCAKTGRPLEWRGPSR